MKRATQRLLAGFRTGNDLAAVLANGAHCADDVILAAHNQQRLARDFGCQAIADIGQLIGVPDADPGTAEHFCLLEGEELGFGIAARGQHLLLHRRLIEARDLGQERLDHG